MPIRYNTEENTFTLPCFRSLVKTLGEYDALVEYQELANRKLLSFYDPKEDFNDFLARESKEQRIHLNDITLKDYKSALVQGYLVFPNASFDDFLNGYEEELKLLIDSEFSSNNFKGCHFEKIKQALEKKSVLLNIDKEKEKLYNYYRLLRNDLAHHIENDYTNAYESINIETFSKQFPKLKAPNPKSSLFFDDFVLCTLNIKDIAFEMTSKLLPYIDWKQRVAEKKKVWLKNYGRYDSNGNEERVRAYVYNAILTRYGIRLSDYDIDSIIDSRE